MRNLRFVSPVGITTAAYAQSAAVGIIRSHMHHFDGDHKKGMHGMGRYALLFIYVTREAC